MKDEMDSQYLYSVIDNFIGGICVLEIDSETRHIKPVSLNNGFYRMMGGTKEQTNAILKDLRLSVIPEDLPLLEQGIDDILADDGSAECEFRLVSHDGSLMWLKLRGNLYSREGTKNIISAVFLDCTEQKAIEEELKRQSNYMHLLMDTDITFDFNCRTDVCIYRINQADSLSHDAVIKGYLQQIPSSGIHKEDIERYSGMINSAMLHAHRDAMEFRSLGIFDHKDEYRWYRVNIVSILGQEGYVSHIIGHMVDIHEEKLREEELRLRADLDPLTGLLNKEATKKLIEQTLKEHADNGGIGALLMVDSDNFKHINDTYGHITGDKVLAKIGEILAENFKGMDVTGRVGGDEFMVFISHLRAKQDAVTLAQRVVSLVSEAFSAESFGKDVSVSVGIAIFPEAGNSYEELYAAADKALYDMKKNGKAGCRLYRSDTV